MLSVLGQLTIHAGTMFYALNMAKAWMSDSELQAAIAFQKAQEKLEEKGIEQDETATKHKPNLLNTIVFLVETAQQVAVMLINYKGRPWMKGATENPGLLYSLAGCVIGICVCAWEVRLRCLHLHPLSPPLHLFSGPLHTFPHQASPYLNETLGLVKLPNDEMRYELLTILAITLLGSLFWDRLCVAIFAPRIFKSQLNELASLSYRDFWGPNSPKYVGWAVMGGAWLYFTEGNIFWGAIAYYFYKKLYKDPTDAAMKRVEDAQAATKEHEAAAGGGARKKNVQAVD